MPVFSDDINECLAHIRKQDAAIAELVEAVETLMEYGIEKSDTWYRLDEIRAIIAKHKGAS